MPVKAAKSTTPKTRPQGHASLRHPATQNSNGAAAESNAAVAEKAEATPTLDEPSMLDALVEEYAAGPEKVGSSAPGIGVGSQHAKHKADGGTKLAHDGPESESSKTRLSHDGRRTSTSKVEVKGSTAAVQHRNTSGEAGARRTTQGNLSAGKGKAQAGMSQSIENGDTTRTTGVQFGTDGTVSGARRKDVERENGTVRSSQTSAAVGSDNAAISHGKGFETKSGVRGHGGLGLKVLGGTKVASMDPTTNEAVGGEARGVQKYVGGRLDVSAGIGKGAMGVSAEGYLEWKGSNSVFSTDPSLRGLDDDAFSDRMATASGHLGPTSLHDMDPRNLDEHQGYGLQTSTAHGGAGSVAVYGFSGGIKGGKHTGQQTTMHKRENGDVMLDVKSTEGGYLGFTAGAGGGVISGERTEAGVQANQARMVFHEGDDGAKALDRVRRTGILPGAVDADDPDYTTYHRLKDKEKLSGSEKKQLHRIAERANAALLARGSKGSLTKLPGVSYELLRDIESNTTTTKADILGFTVGEHQTQETVMNSLRMMSESERILPSDSLTDVVETERHTKNGKENSKVHVDPKGGERLKMEGTADLPEYFTKDAYALKNKTAASQDWHDEFCNDTHTMGGALTNEHVLSMLVGDTDQDVFGRASAHYKGVRSNLDRLKAGGQQRTFDADTANTIFRDGRARDLAKEKWMRNKGTSAESLNSFARTFQREITAWQESGKKGPRPSPHATLHAYARDFQDLEQMALGSERSMPGEKPRQQFPFGSSGWGLAGQAPGDPLGLYNPMLSGRLVNDKSSNGHKYPMSFEPGKSPTGFCSNGLLPLEMIPTGLQMYHEERAGLTEKDLESIPKADQQRYLLEFVYNQQQSYERQKKEAPRDLDSMANVDSASDLYQLASKNPRAAKHLVQRNLGGDDELYAALAMPAKTSNEVIKEATSDMDEGQVGYNFLGVIKNALHEDMDPKARKLWTDAFDIKFND